MDTKICNKCNVEKPVSEFYQSSKQWVFNSCKACESARHSEKNKQRRREKQAVQVLVYFIYAPEVDRVKIGITGGDIAKRFSTLQGQSPTELEMLGVMEATQFTEIELHERFRYCHSHREWFHMDRELKKFIEENSKMPVSIRSAA
jgi:hypothetical protein